MPKTKAGAIEFARVDIMFSRGVAESVQTEWDAPIVPGSKTMDCFIFVSPTER